jgi:DNA polymerase-3 subunit delta'
VPAGEVATVAHGDLERARLLATDERLALRLRLWREIPKQLDGSGHVAAALVDEVRANIDDAGQSLVHRQAQEAAELSERIERYGQRGSGAKELEERHRREQRRLRTDELRLGLTELARAYRDALLDHADAVPLLAGLAAIAATEEGLLRNPSEELALQALFVCLPRLA